MSSPKRMRLADTALLVVDVQEKLLPRILDRDLLVGNIRFLLSVAEALGIPVLATEQYPQGLGPTVATLAPRLPSCFSKKAFSSAAVPEVLEALARDARTQVALVGIEAHVCVQQTALDLLTRGVQPYIATDAVSSRYRVDRDGAFQRLGMAGVVLTTVEACAFEWLETAEHPRFKDVSRLVQERMAWLSSLAAPGASPTP
jgi:nicotinamidase-related amidase